MSPLSRAASVPPSGWPDLVDELDFWREAGRSATLWWRDDDAVEPSAQLDRLMSLSPNVPLALAVIPSLAKPGLACRLARLRGSRVRVLQHGWRHLNHAAGGKKSEFCRDRPLQEAASELAAGRARLSQLFAKLALPVLVPPWNRLDERFLPVLPDCGIRAISQATSRRSHRPAPGLIEANVHIDLVAWRGDRDFIGESAALGGLIRHLQARRLGTACANEPTGILSHHLVQDEAADGFLRRLFMVTGAHGAARWLDATEVFSLGFADPQ
jgi:hypothetical protein